jgi:hypothetical protein
MSEVTQTNKQSITKHVSRACLECRSRHLKCGGQEPICERCRKYNRTCTYVKSHRGGSRKKGVSMKAKTKNNSNNKPNLKMNNKIITTISTDDSNSLISNLNSLNSSNTEMTNKSYPQIRNHKSDILPCVKNGMGEMAESPNCTEACLNVESYNSMPDCLKRNHNFSNIIKKDGSKSSNKINFYPIFNSSKDDEPINMIFDEKKLAPSLDKAYISPALLKDLDVDVILSQYYSSFHVSHPFLPDKKDIKTYLDAIPYKYDLLLGMKIISEGQTTSKYARDIETINFLVMSITKYIRQLGKDFISLQSLLLLSMISHISSLHDLSNTLRDATISLAFELKLNFIDEYNVPSVFLDVNGFLTERDEPPPHSNLLNTPSDTESKMHLEGLFNSIRVNDIPKQMLLETMRKTFWELYYFDSVSGTASGHAKSRIAVQKCLVFYPTCTPLTTFDFKSRAEACKLVNDAISLNISIQSNADTSPHLNHMRAALGNWEMKLANPDTYGMPFLINKFGIVNDGVFEAIMLLNYARIFTHRPFSYLWRSDVSKHPRCTDEKGIDDPCPPLNNKESENSTDSRKIIETRKTIDSANFLMKTLLDSDPSQICKRTPFLACALAFSCLVHLSAYAWVESNMSLLDSMDDANKQISSGELDTYTEYIKLEIGSTLQISRHWSLSAKLITHIAETLCRVSPKLYKRVQAGILGLGFNLATVTNQPAAGASPEIKSENLASSDNSSYNKTNDGFEAANAYAGDTRVKNQESLQEKLFTQPVPNYMLLENQQQYADNNTQFNNYPHQRQPSLPFPQMSPPTYTDSSSTFNTNTNNTNTTTNPTVTTNTTPHTNNNNNNNITNNTSNANFMMEFNDLVNTMNQGNNDDNLANSVLGFPTEQQDYGFLDPPSPSSDTGCDWVDKHVFQFDAFSLPNNG